MPNALAAKDCIKYLNKEGVNATFHYQPLHKSPFAKKHLDSNDDCPVSENISTRIVRLPIFSEMTSQDSFRVVRSFREFLR